MAGFSSEELSAAAGIVLSLGFSYIPGVSQRFDGLTSTQKRLVMLGLLLACALGVFTLSCLNSALLTAPACDRAGVWGLAKVFVAALIANQAAFTISPRSGRQTGEAGLKAVKSATPKKIYKRRSVSRQGFQTVQPPAKNQAVGENSGEANTGSDAKDQRGAAEPRDAGDMP